jgi:hypothetical protein
VKLSGGADDAMNKINVELLFHYVENSAQDLSWCCDTLDGSHQFGLQNNKEKTCRL